MQRLTGFCFGHRDSTYFGVARIGRDPLGDYAKRRGVSIEEAEPWLLPTGLIKPKLPQARRANDGPPLFAEPL